MNKYDFTNIVNNKNNISAEEITALKALVQEFPWYSTAQNLLVKALHTHQHYDYEKQLKNSALIAPDRNVLYNLINNLPLNTQHQAIEAEEHAINNLHIAEPPVEVKTEEVKPVEEELVEAFAEPEKVETTAPTEPILEDFEEPMVPLNVYDEITTPAEIIEEEKEVAQQEIISEPIEEKTDEIIQLAETDGDLVQYHPPVPDYFDEIEETDATKNIINDIDDDILVGFDINSIDPFASNQISTENIEVEENIPFKEDAIEKEEIVEENIVVSQELEEFTTPEVDITEEQTSVIENIEEETIVPEVLTDNIVEPTTEEVVEEISTLPEITANDATLIEEDSTDDNITNKIDDDFLTWLNNKQKVEQPVAENVLVNEVISDTPIVEETIEVIADIVTANTSNNDVFVEDQAANEILDTNSEETVNNIAEEKTILVEPSFPSIVYTEDEIFTGNFKQTIADDSNNILSNHIANHIAITTTEETATNIEADKKANKESFSFEPFMFSMGEFEADNKQLADSLNYEIDINLIETVNRENLDFNSFESTFGSVFGSSIKPEPVTEIKVEKVEPAIETKVVTPIKIEKPIEPIVVETKTVEPKTVKPEPVENLADKNSILDKFLRENPSISRPKAEFYNPVNMARQSAEEDEELVSETLAQIYVKQGLYKKAINIYEKLGLLYPNKLTYFAALINHLKTTHNVD